MDDPVGTWGAIAELCMWTGLVLGAVCLFVRLIVQAVDGSWTRTHAVLMNGSSPVRLRWSADDGMIRERALTPAESEQLAGTEDPDVYYSDRSPDRVRLDPRSHASRVLGLLGLVFFGVAALSLAASLILLFATG